MVLNEFCDKGKIEMYRNEVALILDTIRTKGVKVSPTYNHETVSSTLWSDKGVAVRIRIRIKVDFLGLPVIWDLLHEYGHMLDLPLKSGLSNQERLNREERAWDNARKELYNYPRLLHFVVEFNSYGELCLATYKV